MESATERVRREVEALWTEVFGSPPVSGADPGVMLEQIIQRLEPREYQRLASADDASGLVFPRPPRPGEQHRASPSGR